MSHLIQHTIQTPYMVGPAHCYSGEIAGELVLFDTGPSGPQAERYLRENIDLERLRHVFITHCHIDHYGQAHWLEKNSDARIYLPFKDSLKIRNHGLRLDEMYNLLAGLGFTRESLEGLRKIFDSGVLFPPAPRDFLIAEKDIPEHLQVEVIDCPGHSQSDLVYAGEDWAVTGDTLLRGVFQSPVLDVDLEDGTRFKNYQAYCATLVKLASLRGKTVLPGHRYKVKSIDHALVFYVSKLLERVVQLIPYKDEDDLPVLMQRLLKGRINDVFHLYLKASEIVFMKDFFESPDLLKIALRQVGIFDKVSELYSRAVGE
jgi:hydroxyacylglutathione hydrolase